MRNSINCIVTIVFVAEFFSTFCFQKGAGWKQRTAKYTIISCSEDSVDELEDAINAKVAPLPSTSSKVNFGDQTPTNIKYDLWVVGAGTLGSIAAKIWKNHFPDARVHAETKTTSRHEYLQSLDVSCSLRSDRSTADEKCARNVLIALPPSSSADYIDEINVACRIWGGSLGNGNLVYTSSIGVYGDSIGNIVNEKFRVDTRSQRTTLMVNAEQAVLSREGIVVRLAGLYTENRGAHSFWLKNGTVQGAGDVCINQLHYNDAAEVAIAALRRGTPRLVYMASDDTPLTRAEICEAALASNLYPDCKMPQFTATFGLQTKLCDDSFSRNALEWKPKYTNFGDYMARIVGGNKSYAVPTLVNGKARPNPKLKFDDAESLPSKKSTSSLWLPGDSDGLL